jgi:ABC-type Zn uptake system ZnuABC Zn-binding protein ZnuA
MCMRQVWTGLLIAAVVAGAGCDREGARSPARGTSQAAPGPKVMVIASIYPMADMATRVGGADWVKVEWLVDAGRRPEEVEGDNSARRRADNAVAVITAGPWDNGWALPDVAPDSRRERVIDPAQMPAAQGADADAYLWLDPAVLRQMVERLRIRLTVYDGRHEADVRAGAAAYQAEVDAVVGEMKAGLAVFKGRKVLVVRSVWGPMLARYGLEQVAPVTGVTEERLTATDFKDRIVPAAKAIGAKAIFVDEATPAGVRQQIEDRTGLRVLTLDAVGSSAAEGRSTWAKVMRYNLGQLRKGL